MTWAELIKAKDRAWKEFQRADPHTNDVSDDPYFNACYLNYEMWQALVDEGTLIYAEYKHSQGWT